MQFTASRNIPGIGRVAVFNPQRNVPLEFLIQTFAHLTRCNKLSILARERRIVHHHVNADCRLFNADAFQTLLIFWIG